MGLDDFLVCVSDESLYGYGEIIWVNNQGYDIFGFGLVIVY